LGFLPVATRIFASALAISVDGRAVKPWPAAPFDQNGAMLPLVLLAPLFIIFEFWQFVISERYLGIKQIASGADPRTLGLSEITAFFWSVGIMFYWLWMLAMLLPPFGRVYAAVLVASTLIGFALRRNCSIKWVLVILTFEGSIRIGMLGSLCFLAWKKL
jgi:hypothetical protein